MSLEFLGRVFSGTHLGACTFGNHQSVDRIESHAMGWAHNRSDCNQGQGEAQRVYPGHSSWGRGEDEEPTTEPESWNSNQITECHLSGCKDCSNFRELVSPTIREYSFPVNPFLSWNGIKWKSSDLITQVANECTRRESTDAPRHSSKLWRLDAGMLNVVLGEGVWGPTLAARGARCLCDVWLPNKCWTLFSLFTF